MRPFLTPGRRTPAGTARPAGGGAFSLVEIIIAMAISLMVMGVVMFSFFTTQKNTDKGLEILDFVRKSTLLLENVKNDVRSALRDSDSIRIDGTKTTIRRVRGESESEVVYEYDTQNRLVHRTEEGRRKSFGSAGTRGEIVQFEVKDFEKFPGFYQVTVDFEVPNKKAATPEIQRQSGGATERPYKFQVLVSKRGGEGTDETIRWHYAFE